MPSLKKIVVISMLAIGSMSLSNSYRAEPRSERSVSRTNEKFLGNVVGIRDTVPEEFTQYWNQLTPENNGKWQLVEPERDRMDWTKLDIFYEFSLSNNVIFKWHTPIWWHNPPKWLKDLPPSEQKAEFEEWIQAFMTRYPDTAIIEVVNEALVEPPFYAEALGGSGETGFDWVIEAFRIARKQAPHAQLLINEINVLKSNQRTTKYIALIELLKERGLVDGVGVQGHFLTKNDRERVSTNLDRITDIGLDVYITELDIRGPSEQAQLESYQAIFPLFWENPHVKGITLWGYREGEIWQKDAYLLRKDGTERPALTWLKQYTQDDSS
ncbi:MAG: endo-1,4-beta-xylanase [Cyanophyceae cyanobacterium]